MTDEAHPPLLRDLRRRDLIGLQVNSMVGSGMMAAPAKVFAIAHGWSFAVLGLSAVLVAPLILCFADLGSRFSDTGGPYLYARSALPGWLAFCVGWLLWISQGFSTATLTNLLVSYLAGFAPVLGEGLPRAAVILAFGAIITGIALRGIRGSARSSTVIAALKIAFVLGFVAACVGFIRPDHLAAPRPALGAATLGQALMIYIFAYTGFERAGILAGEARDPQRDLPLALFGSVAFATIAYAGVLLVCIGVLGDPSGTDRPLAEVGRELFGPAGAAAISIGAIIVIVGTILVAAIGMPRMLMALADEGQLPAFLSKVHPRWRTPHVAIVLSSAITFGAAIFSDLLSALTFSTATRVLCYIISCIALWRLAGRADSVASFSLPARRPIALASAAIFAVVLVVGATKELPALGVALAVGLTLYGLTLARSAATVFTRRRAEQRSTL